MPWFSPRAAFLPINTKSMRVLHVISDMDPRSGGPTTALLGLALAQARAGLDVSVVSSWQGTPPVASANQLREQGIELLLIGPGITRVGWHPRMGSKLRAAMARADIVHIHALWEEIQHRAARAAHALDIPYVITPHGMLDPWSMRQRPFRKQLYMALRMRTNLRRAAALHFTSTIERDQTVDLGRPVPSIVEPNGVDLSEFVTLPPPGAFRARYPAIGQRPIILFLSRLHYKKGFDLLIPAFAQAQLGEAMLVIAGPDSDGYQAKIADMVQQHGLEQRVIFTGMLYGADRIAALADADLFVLPSYQENFGIAVVEALGAGTPVIISDQVQIYKEIAAGQVGAVVPTDAGRLAEELTRWMGDASLRQAAAERARPFVWAHYDWQNIAQHWREHYTAAVESHTARRRNILQVTGKLAPRAQPTRVVHVISSLDQRRGGPAMALAGLAVAQARAGINVSVVCTSREDDDPRFADELRGAGVPVEVIGPCATRLTWHPRIAPVLKQFLPRAEVIHIHALWEEIQHQAAQIARRRGIPYIIRPCGMLDPWSLSQKWLKKQLYLAMRMRKDMDHAAALHFTSHTECDLVAPLHLTPPSIIEPNGVDLSEFETLPPPGSFRQRHPEVGQRPIVLFLSRLHHKKGLDLLIPAFAKAYTGEAMLVVAGPSAQEYQGRLESLVRELGLRDRVLFTGMLYGRQRVEALADAELFVLPSYQENFGIAVVEALAAGTPVIISDQVNIHQEVSAAKVGAVVHTDVDALALELTRWLADADLRRAAAERARPFVRQRYDWREIAAHWREHYQRIAELGQPASPKPQEGVR